MAALSLTLQDDWSQHRLTLIGCVKSWVKSIGNGLFSEVVGLREFALPLACGSFFENDESSPAFDSDGCSRERFVGCLPDLTVLGGELTICDNLTD